MLAELSHRDRRPEVMDQPGLDPLRHARALRGLERINIWSRSASLVWSAIRPLALAHRSRPLRILDVASGGGDVAVGIARLASRAGVEVEIMGCDLSDTAVEYASRQATARGVDIAFQQCDVFRDPLPDNFDCVVSSLFLHHLTREQAVELLCKMRAAARRMVVVNDLIRGKSAWLLAIAATRLLTRSDVVHTDGPLSVRAAFTTAEAAELARLAELDGAVITKRWPFRFLMQWTRPQ